MPKLLCSFCRKDEDHVDKLLGGPGVFICDGCVEICVRILQGKRGPTFPTWEQMSDDELLASVGAAGDSLRHLEASVRDQVRVLRARGVTWERIGEAMGVSRQAVWQRFADTT